jgi:hypothetical protein
VNNAYLFLTNLKSLSHKNQQYSSLPQSEGESAKDSANVNKSKVGLGMIWYGGSLVGYALMEKYGQGLQIESSE